MKFLQSSKTFYILPVIYILLFFIVFALFQNPGIYSHTLGLISSNYQTITDGNAPIIKVKKPYEKVEESKFYYWDGKIYDIMRKNNIYGDGDKIVNNNIKTNYFFMWFPLYPFLWKITHFSPMIMSIFNYLMFVTGLLILFHFLGKDMEPKNKLLLYILFLFSPIVAVFHMPYSESLLFLLFSIAVIGYFKNNYILLFAGLLGVAMTRTSITFTIIASLMTIFISLLRHKNILQALKEVLLISFPLLLGMLIVGIIQHSFVPTSYFNYLITQKYFGLRVFSFPHDIRDRSVESFGINLSTFFYLIAPVCIYLCYYILKVLSGLNFRFTFKTGKEEDEGKYKEEFLFLFSLIHTVLVSVFVFFFQDGSLTGLYRYLICTPFFIIIFIAGKKYLRQAGNNINPDIILLLITFFYIIYFVVKPFARSWGFYNSGAILMLLMVILWTYYEKIPGKYLILSLFVYVILNIIWSTYLINIYLSGGPSFT
jgi:hypothetical protein